MYYSRFACFFLIYTYGFIKNFNAADVYAIKHMKVVSVYTLVP